MLLTTRFQRRSNVERAVSRGLASSSHFKNAAVPLSREAARAHDQLIETRTGQFGSMPLQKCPDTSTVNPYRAASKNISFSGRRPVSGQLCDHTTAREAVYGFGFLLPFGYRHLLLEPSCFRRTASAFLTVGLPDHRPGPRRGFHVPHAQDTTGQGAASTPGRWCSRDRSDAPDRHLLLSSSQPCTPAPHPSIRGSP